MKREGTGGYLYKDKGYQFDDIIKISDVNRDGKSDINVYNDAKSGNGQNSTYDVWLNKGGKLVYSQEFSIPNLKYINTTDEYYSRGSGGGGDFVETFYKLINNDLKPIREKIRGFNRENDGYRILEINLITNDTIRNEMEYVR